MEWVDRLNESIQYIENHLTEELDYRRLGQIACCSSCHFQRMFTYMANMPLSEYIRRRKMSLAAVDLQNGGKVVDVAAKYGYSSPTAFNRAFRAVHGIPPSAAQALGTPVKSFPPLTFVLAVEGAAELNYRIETREAIRVVGLSAPLRQTIEENFTLVPGMWQEAASSGALEELAAMMEGPPMGLLGVSACGDGEQWRYLIAAATGKAAGRFEEYQIPAAVWAIFPGTGTNRSMQELERRVVTQWFPTSGYEYDDGPDIEVYLNPDPSNAQYELWIPVRKKEEKSFF